MKLLEAHDRDLWVDYVAYVPERHDGDARIPAHYFALLRAKGGGHWSGHGASVAAAVAAAEAEAKATKDRA